MSSQDGSDGRLEELQRRLDDARGADRADHLRVLIALENLTEWVERIASRQAEADRELASREGVIDEYRRWRTEVERDMRDLREALARLDERYAPRTELKEGYLPKPTTLLPTPRLTPTAEKLLAGAVALVALSLVIALGGGDVLRGLLK